MDAEEGGKILGDRVQEKEESSGVKRGRGRAGEVIGERRAGAGME